MDYVYPTESADPVEADTFDKAIESVNMIALIESGAPADYSGFNEGERLDKIHVCSIILAGRNCSKEASDLYDEIEAEKKALEAIHPCEFTTVASFKTALGEVSNYITVNTWVAKLQLKFSCDTWAEMQTWCSTNYNQEIV